MSGNSFRRRSNWLVDTAQKENDDAWNDNPETVCIAKLVEPAPEL
jgi:hypothetical protein